MSCIEVCGEQMLGSATFVDGLDRASRLVGGASCLASSLDCFLDEGGIQVSGCCQ